jgi:hypothetical protein
MDLAAQSLSPEGFAENGRATLLFLSRRAIKDFLLRHASSAARSGRNSNYRSFLTGCLNTGHKNSKLANPAFLVSTLPLNKA